MTATRQPEKDLPEEEEKKLQEAHTVRGSGFTYDEDEQRTDQPIPEEAAGDTVVRLPDLGAPGTM